MRHAVSNELYSYWRALRKGGAPPERNEVEPGAIRGALADTFVLEFEADEGFPFRICGSNVNAMFQKELRGASFLEIWRDDDRALIRSILEMAADEEAPFLIAAEARPVGLQPIEVEVTLLPLRHQGMTHARMLGAFAVRAGAGADWLGLIASAPAAATGWRRLEPGPADGADRPSPAARTTQAGPSRATRPDEPARQTSSRRRPEAKRLQLST